MAVRKNGAATIRARKYCMACGRISAFAPKNRRIGPVHIDNTHIAVVPDMSATHSACAISRDASSRSERANARAIAGVVASPRKLKQVNEMLNTLLPIPTPPRALAPK